MTNERLPGGGLMATRRSNFPPKMQEIRWAGAQHGFFAMAAGTAAQVMVTDGSKETILRIRGSLVSWVDATQAPGGITEVAVGAFVVQAGSGTTVIQSPLSDADAPWLFFERWLMGYEEMVTDVIDVPGITSYRKVIDTKAMRILRPGREVQLVAQVSSLSGAQSVNIHFGFRMLLGTH